MLTREEVETMRSANGGTVEHVCGAGDSWEIVLKKPERKHYKAYRARCYDPSQKHNAQEMLVRDILVHPPLSAFDSLLDQNVGICESEEVTDAVKRLCGLENDTSKKY